MPFTFKTEKPTGRYASFYPTSHLIKLKKEVVGTIDDKEFYIRLHIVRDGNLKWVRLVQNSKSLQEAKDWLNENFENITAKCLYGSKL